MSANDDDKNKDAATVNEEEDDDDDVDETPVTTTTGEGESSAKKGKKKNKKKNKKGKGEAEGAGAEDLGKETDVAAALEILREISAKKGKAPAAFVPPEDKVYQFWDSQPVPKFSEDTDPNANEPIIPVYDNIRQTPLPLQSGFSWCDCNIDDEAEMAEVYGLLNQNYVEDDDAMFRFDYSKEFLRWALKPPGWLRQWHTGVRVDASKKLVGFITAVPADMRVYGKDVKMVEINFLCVHKKLRDKRLAPILIKEITRRVHVEGIFQAVFTAGTVLPRPVSKCQYFHRSINVKKLIECRFSSLHARMTLKRLIRLNELPDAPVHANLRPMEERDVPACHRLLSNYLAEKTNLYQEFSLEEFAHWILPRAGVVGSYVLEQADGSVKDFCSFFILPSTVINNPKHSTLVAAYSYYNVATTISLEELMKESLIMARLVGVDVFNALDVQENKTFLDSLRFGPGDGHLQYYVYNWRCPTMPSEKIGLVLL